MTKTYTVPLRNARLQLSRGMGVGTEFMDHGTTMVITGVGYPYKIGKEKLFDFFAEEKTAHEKRNARGARS